MILAHPEIEKGRPAGRKGGRGPAARRGSSAIRGGWAAAEGKTALFASGPSRYTSPPFDLCRPGQYHRGRCPRLPAGRLCSSASGRFPITKTGPGDAMSAMSRLPTDRGHHRAQCAGRLARNTRHRPPAGRRDSGDRQQFGRPHRRSGQSLRRPGYRPRLGRQFCQGPQRGARSCPGRMDSVARRRRIR